MEEDLINFDQQPAANLSSLRLPTFWADKPNSWFALAESRFRLHAVLNEQARFDLLVSSLTKETVSLVLDLVEFPPEVRPYTALKQRLLASHQLTDYQRIAQLHKLEPMGARKPSELLGAMLELCPRGQESNMFFTHLFLERLPAELRIMLGEDDHQDPRLLAEKADKLWALHGVKHSSLAVVDLLSEDPALVNAVANRGRGGRNANNRGRGANRGRGGQQKNTNPSSTSSSSTPTSMKPMEMARIQSGLCYYHFKFGDKSYNCTPPCTWEN
jgi:hypothetical protein